MTHFKILFLNLGYARGISGQLSEHVRFVHRHVYCSRKVQRKTLEQLNQLIKAEQPDLCCFIEIDRGSLSSAYYNQLEVLLNDKYIYYEIENKYSPESYLRSFAMTVGKSNAMISKRKYSVQKLYFSSGIKKLIYRIQIDINTVLYFTHYSLNKVHRTQQLRETLKFMKREEGEVILLGDFNILSGLDEIRLLLDEGRFKLLNRADVPTFLFHKRKLVLDLCICSCNIGLAAKLKILPQSYSDHAALIVEW